MTNNSSTVFEDVFSEEIWNITYKDHNDNNVDDTHRRVSKAIASVEETDELKAIWEENFYDMLTNFKGVPGGRILSNAGTEWQGTTLMNCFVGPRVKNDVDSLAGILYHLEAQSKTLKSEGGWGENFSYIRPRGAFIHGIGVETPGAVKYMELFDKTSEIITAGSGKKSEEKKAKGKIRKGAQMAVLDVWHPDIIEFITAKQQPGRLTKFNMSVNVSDAFMEKLKKVIELEKRLVEVDKLNDANFCGTVPLNLSDELAALDKWDLIFPETTNPSYKKVWNGDIKLWQEKGLPVKVFNTVSVRWLWNLIMESTYNRAEPGVLFLDRANYFNPLYYGETIFATNPCGEQTLSPGNICCLGTLNLTQFINQAGTGFILPKIKKYVGYMVRFLDNVNSYSTAPLPEYIDSMKKKRRIGVGVMGWGSALFMMRIKFASEQANAIRDELMTAISRAAYEASIDLAIEKGKFEYCDPVLHADGAFVKQLKLSEDYMTKLRTSGIRNSSLMSQQPNGSTSIYANITSGGIEPIFMPEYIRTTIVPSVPTDMIDVTPKYYEGEWKETSVFKFAKEGADEILKGKFNGVTYKIDKSRGLTREVLCEDYGVRWLKQRELWDPKAEWAVTTTQISALEHVTDLKGFSKFTDSACSKTINIPNEYSFDDFKNIYLDAYNTGYIKGLTTYRAGTMASVLSAKDEADASNSDEEIIVEEVKMPISSPAIVKILKAEGRKWYLTVIQAENSTRPYALFVHTNSPEKGVTTSDAVERLIALAKKKKIKAQYIADLEAKVQNENNVSKITRSLSLLLRHGVLIKNIVYELNKVQDVYVNSFLFQITKFLSQYIKDGTKVDDATCSSCGSHQVVFSEGCYKCMSCGSSKC
jgi:ribonucleoside-diphosphate reductase alpha chain